MATNHQVINEALDRLDRSRHFELPDYDINQANPTHDDDDGEGLDDELDEPVEDLTPDELDELAAGPPWALALLDRCYGCDSRSAELVAGMCPSCRADRAMA